MLGLVILPSTIGPQEKLKFNLTEGNVIYLAYVWCFFAKVHGYCLKILTGMNHRSKKIASLLILTSIGNMGVADPGATKTHVWNLAFPEATASLGAVVVADHLYVHGGHTGETHKYSTANHSQNFLRVPLRGKNRQWEKLPLASPAQSFGLVAHEGRIYRIGGSRATNAPGEQSNLRSLATCAVFDTRTGKWSRFPALPAPRSSHDATVHEGRIYVTGGWNMGNGKEDKDRWYRHGLMADLSVHPIVWKKLPASDWVIRAHATAAVNGKLYVAGGISPKGTLNEVHVLDLKQGKWAAGPKYPGQGRAKSFGMTLCVWNGQLHANSFSSTVRRLTAEGDGWEDAGIRLTHRRYFHRMLPAGRDRLLFVAGADFEKHHATIEEFKTSAATPSNTGSRWPGFRGDGTSRTTAGALPLEWSDNQNVRWRRKLPGYGQSSPVIWEGRIFTTATEGTRSETLTIHCTSLKTGRSLWNHSFKSSQPVTRSRMVSQAAPTPVVDADGVYAFFESGDLIALNFEGKPRWHRKLAAKLGPFTAHHGLGSSLVQSADRLGLLLDHPDPSHLLCLRKADGKNIWAIRREKRVSWSTPTLVGEALLVSSNGMLEEFDFRTGKRRWHVDGLTGNTVASATAAGNLVIVGSSAKGQCLAVRRGGSGDVTETHIAWRAMEATSSFSSPLVDGGHAYFVSRAGILNCIDLATGKKQWDRRLGASCWASPIAAGDLLYFFNKAGQTTVLKAGGRQEVVAENKLTSGGTLYGVAVVDGHFILRTGTELICIHQSKDNKP